MKALLTAFSLSAFAAVAGMPPTPLPGDYQTTLDSATSATLYSLDPSNSKLNKKPCLMGYHVIGQTKLNPAETKQAVATVEDAITHWNGATTNCIFEPRHGLRIVSKGHTYDFLVCYHCLQIEAQCDGKVGYDSGVTGSPEVLNQLLRRHKVPLPPEN